MDNEKLGKKFVQIKWTQEEQRNSCRQVEQKDKQHKKSTHYKYIASLIGSFVIILFFLGQLLKFSSFDVLHQSQQQNSIESNEQLSITSSYIYKNKAGQKEVDFLNPFFWEKKRLIGPLG
ncbi:hypothetical protein ACIQZG_14585 [Lysinibacillus sp. NPDC096418]|uniref:hypothetical protein n=1 Tax=Lysinibacillus sp. NPDC096418 TaxID=3364138 RepID=UPI003806E1EF